MLLRSAMENEKSVKIRSIRQIRVLFGLRLNRYQGRFMLLLREVRSCVKSR